MFCPYANVPFCVWPSSSFEVCFAWGKSNLPSRSLLSFFWHLKESVTHPDCSLRGSPGGEGVSTLSIVHSMGMLGLAGCTLRVVQGWALPAWAPPHSVLPGFLAVCFLSFWSALFFFDWRDETFVVGVLYVLIFVSRFRASSRLECLWSNQGDAVTHASSSLVLEVPSQSVTAAPSFRGLLCWCFRSPPGSWVVLSRRT